MSKQRRKIGISFDPFGQTYGRYGREKFQKLRELGFQAADYNLANTERMLYSMDPVTLEEKTGHLSVVQLRIEKAV